MARDRDDGRFAYTHKKTIEAPPQVSKLLLELLRQPSNSQNSNMQPSSTVTFFVWSSAKGLRMPRGDVFAILRVPRAGCARWPGTLGSWLAGHCSLCWVLVWAGACYWHGVRGFMFNSSSSCAPCWPAGFFFGAGWCLPIYTSRAGPRTIHHHQH